MPILRKDISGICLFISSRNFARITFLVGNLALLKFPVNFSIATTFSLNISKNNFPKTSQLKQKEIQRKSITQRIGTKIIRLVPMVRDA